MTSRTPHASGKKSTSLWWMELKTLNGRAVRCSDLRRPSAQRDRLLVAKWVGARRDAGTHVDPFDFELESDRILVVRKHFDGIRVRRAGGRAESLACHEDVVRRKRELQLLCFQQNLVLQFTGNHIGAEGDELLRLVLELVVPGRSHSHARRRVNDRRG